MDVGCLIILEVGCLIRFYFVGAYLSDPDSINI